MKLDQLRKLWLSLTKEHFPAFELPWRTRDTRVLRKLVLEHGEDAVELLFLYVHERWSHRVKGFSDPPPAPDLSWVASMAKWLVVEAKEYPLYRDTWVEVMRWRKSNPNRLLPDDLASRLDKARNGLEALSSLTKPSHRGRP